jgi:hypothetical protein
MRIRSRLTPIASLGAAAFVALAWCGTAAADSLSCRSVNGNVVCAAPNAQSCQTVDGKTVCMSGKGDAVQIFGGAPPEFQDPALEEPELELDEATRRLLIERRGPAGRTLSLWREGRELHIDTGRLQLDIR